MTALILILIVAAAALYVAHAFIKIRIWLSGWTASIAAAIWLLPVGVIAAWWWGVMTWHTALLCLAPTGVLVWRRRMRVAGAVNRLGDRARRKSGVASTLDIWRYGSQLPLRRKATVLRPSTANLARVERLRLPATEFGGRIARVGMFRWIWTSVEMVTLVVGGPRKGKTGYLGTRIVDAPGAVLATSTRSDLHDLTAAQRRAKGSPVYVFNAVGLGNVPSTLLFDPIVGCEDPAIAYERATDMALPAAGGAERSGDREYWDSEGRRFLSMVFHAAALGRKRDDSCTMRDVEEWRADPERHKGTIASYLRQSPQPGMATLIESFTKLNERTRTSISQAVARATAWLTSPAACAATKPGARVDVEAFIKSRASIYLIGAKETQSEALVAGLVGYIAREARRLAGLSPNGRLDPPLSLVLDEAGLLAPPLHDWSADMGGRGVCIIAAFQSRAQMLDCWTRAQAGVTLNNSATVVLFGGTKNPDDLEVWTRLAGRRDEKVEHKDKYGKVTSSTVREVAVFSPPQISNLRGATKRGHAQVIVYHDGMPSVLAKAHMLWQRGPIWRATRCIENSVFSVLARSIDMGLVLFPWWSARMPTHTDRIPALTPEPASAYQKATV